MLSEPAEISLNHYFDNTAGYYISGHFPGPLTELVNVPYKDKPGSGMMALSRLFMKNVRHGHFI